MSIQTQAHIRMHDRRRVMRCSVPHCLRETPVLYHVPGFDHPMCWPCLVRVSEMLAEDERAERFGKLPVAWRP